MALDVLMPSYCLRAMSTAFSVPVNSRHLASLTDEASLTPAPGPAHPTPST